MHYKLDLKRFIYFDTTVVQKTGSDGKMEHLSEGGVDAIRIRRILI